VKNEMTGPAVRKIAARLAKVTRLQLISAFTEDQKDRDGWDRLDKIVAEIRAVAASALTQSPPAKSQPAPKSKKIAVRKH
jgi:hypothetical protein